MNKMNTKNILVSFLAVFVLATLATTVSAGTDYTINPIQVNNVNVDENSSTMVSLDAGDSVNVEVYFTSSVYDEDVTVYVEFKGDDFKVSGETRSFDVLENESLRKVVTVKLPAEIEDKLYDDDVRLTVEIDGDNSNEEVERTLLVKRMSYDVAIKSITTSQRVSAGDTFPVDVVLKNIGFNDLDDLYVTASIEALGVMQSGYFGDIVALECGNNNDDEFPWNSSTLDRNCNEDDSDSVHGILNLEVPYDVKSGIYTVEVTVENDDVVETKAVQLVIENDFESSVFKSGNDIWLVNPTDQVVGYRIVAESPASVSKSIVFVPAGASESVTVDPNADGEYSFDVSVFSTKGELVDTITFSGSNGSATSESTETNPVIILTVILAIIFIVLLVVLIVLLGKKPEKSGEFGESYY